MYYAHPGPRCTNHARQQLSRARAAYSATPSSASKKGLQTALSEYHATPAGIADLRAEGKHLEADIAQAKRTAQLDAYRATQAPQRLKRFPPPKPELNFGNEAKEAREEVETLLRDPDLGHTLKHGRLVRIFENPATNPAKLHGAIEGTLNCSPMLSDPETLDHTHLKRTLRYEAFVANSIDASQARLSPQTLALIATHEGTPFRARITAITNSRTPVTARVEGLQLASEATNSLPELIATNIMDSFAQERNPNPALAFAIANTQKWGDEAGRAASRELIYDLARTHIHTLGLTETTDDLASLPSMWLAQIFA